jgi:hypothetical protein
MKPTFRRLVFGALVLLAASALAALPDREDVTLETSEDCYALGDTVHITVTNNLDATVYMPSDPPWSIRDASADTFVCCYVLWVIISLDGHDSLTYGWDQTNYMGNPVPAGTYYVQLSYSHQQEPWDPHAVIDTFTIGGPSPAPAQSWGSIKPLWR